MNQKVCVLLHNLGIIITLLVIGIILKQPLVLMGLLLLRDIPDDFMGHGASDEYQDCYNGTNMGFVVDEIEDEFEEEFDKHGDTSRERQKRASKRS